jgi:transcriptional regulator with XRE-family HTH domain
MEKQTRARITTLASLLERSTRNRATGCMEWARGRQASGYGYLWYVGDKWLAHRLSWHLAFGPIPAGKLVCHTCDNRTCINPKHLFLGTYQDNAKDMIQKGRAPIRKGAKSAANKLTESQVREIISSPEAMSVLAKRHGVSQPTISQIKSGKRWAHIEGERVLVKHYAAGRRNGFASLTREQALDIRAATGTQLSIAKKFGVSQTTVSSIKRGDTWKDLQGETHGTS